MRVNRGSLGKVVANSLVPTQKVFYQKVRNVVGKAGVDLRYKKMKTTADGVRKVFKALTDEGLLKKRVAAQGAIAFGRKVRAEERQSTTKPKKNGEPESHGKEALRKRLMDEAKQKQKIDEALKVGKNEKPTQKKEIERREMRAAPNAAPVTPQARVIPIGTISRTPRPEVAPTVERDSTVKTSVVSLDEARRRKAKEEDELALPLSDAA